MLCNRVYLYGKCPNSFPVCRHPANATNEFAQTIDPPNLRLIARLGLKISPLGYKGGVAECAHQCCSICFKYCTQTRRVLELMPKKTALPIRQHHVALTNPHQGAVEYGLKMGNMAVYGSPKVWSKPFEPILLTRAIHM